MNLKSSSKSQFFKGFLFGMLLQIAIGPVCIFILNCGSTGGFFYAETAVFSVALVDGIYIFLAVMGIAQFLSGKITKLILKTFGAIVLTIFGADIILKAFGMDFLPAVHTGTLPRSPFITGFILTASNPLTIIFWAGVFSTRISEYDCKQTDLLFFAAGCIFSTLLFLSLIGAAGSSLHYLFPPALLTILNGIIGAVLIFFAVHLLMKKTAGV